MDLAYILALVNDVLTAVGGLVVAASVLVKALEAIANLTASKADDEALSKVSQALDRAGAMIKPISFRGKR